MQQLIKTSSLFVLIINTGDEDEVVIFPWIPMGVLFGAEQQFLPATDDGFEGPIEIEPGFPFGSSIQTQVFVSFLN